MNPQPKAPSEIQRWDLVAIGGVDPVGMTALELDARENPNGTYVLHSDHEAAMKEALEVIQKIANGPTEGLSGGYQLREIARAFLQSKGVK